MRLYSLSPLCGQLVSMALVLILIIRGVAPKIACETPHLFYFSPASKTTSAAVLEPRLTRLDSCPSCYLLIAQA